MRDKVPFIVLKIFRRKAEVSTMDNLHATISIRIFSLLFLIFLMAPVGRICLNIKLFSFGDHFIDSHELDVFEQGVRL